VGLRKNLRGKKKLNYGDSERVSQKDSLPLRSRCPRSISKGGGKCAKGSKAGKIARKEDVYITSMDKTTRRQLTSYMDTKREQAPGTLKPAIKPASRMSLNKMLPEEYGQGKITGENIIFKEISKPPKQLLTELGGI